MCNKANGTCSCRVGWEPPLCQGDSGLKMDLIHICTMCQTCRSTSMEAYKISLLQLSLLFFSFFLPPPPLSLSLSLSLSLFSFVLSFFFISFCPYFFLSFFPYFFLFFLVLPACLLVFLSLCVFFFFFFLFFVMVLYTCILLFCLFLHTCFSLSTVLSSSFFFFFFFLFSNCWVLSSFRCISFFVNDTNTRAYAYMQTELTSRSHMQTELTSCQTFNFDSLISCWT